MLELNFRSNTKVFVSLSIMLHIALFGAAAYYNINKPIAEDIGRRSDSNRRIIISSVFREKLLPAENTIEADDSVLKEENILNTDRSEIQRSNSNNDVNESASDNEISSKTDTEQIRETETADNVISSDSPQTLTIKNFTTDLDPVYPKFARRNNYEGIVRVSLTVNRNGRGENIKIVKSSGYSILDKAAVKAVKKAVFKAKNSRIYYLSAALNKPLLVDINFSLT